MACLLFATGFALRGNDVFLERMGLGSYAVVTEQNPGATVSGNAFDSVSARVAEVQGVLEQRSLDQYELEPSTRILIAGLLKQTGDPYARYYDAQAYASLRAGGSDDAYGIGALFGEYRNQAYVVDLIPGSSAQASGVLVGDFVVAIDGERKEGGWTLRETIAKVEQEEGTSVVMTWRRPETLESAGGEEFTTTLTCKPESQENVSSWLGAENVGYVKVRQLGRTTSANVSAAVRDLAGQGALSFVLDLRDCPGGYLSQAVEVASLFMGSGPVVQVLTKDGAPSSKLATGPSATDAPLVVLVNGNTAAATEVLAAALQDAGRATIVGQQTMGKGTVQVMYELSFGGAVSYTAAEYRTPLGRTLDGSGVSPDIAVENDPEQPGRDVQLDLAVEAAASARNSG